MKIKNLLILGTCLIVSSACWDTVEHHYDCVDNNCTTTPEDCTETDAGSADGGDLDTSSNFGDGCVEHSDCRGYDGERRCLHNIVNMIYAPGGSCTACCDTPGKDVCGPGIDCVGVENVYLVCLAHCDSNADCRTDEGWECRELYYIPEAFPGNFCLPNEELVGTETPEQDPQCPWPWLDEF